MALVTLVPLVASALVVAHLPLLVVKGLQEVHLDVVSRLMLLLIVLVALIVLPPPSLLSPAPGHRLLEGQQTMTNSCRNHSLHEAAGAGPDQNPMRSCSMPPLELALEFPAAASLHVATCQRILRVAAGDVAKVGPRSMLCLVDAAEVEGGIP